MIGATQLVFFAILLFIGDQKAPTTVLGMPELSKDGKNCTFFVFKFQHTSVSQ